MNPSRVTAACLVTAAFCSLASTSSAQFYPAENVDYFLKSVGTAVLGSSDKGCHGQGVKFDGSRFYSTCMETNGNNTAYLYVHDAAGNRIKQFQYSSEYEHPSGIMLDNGWAYTGFTSEGVNMYTRLYRFNGAGTVSYQGFFDHSVGFAGGIFTTPTDFNTTIKTRYYSFDQYYERQCTPTDGTCGTYTDYTTANNIDGEEGVQDCDFYYKNGRWYKACLLLSSTPNRIRVWNASQTRLGPDNALANFSMSGQPGESGGFGFYQDPSGVMWIVTSPPPATNRRFCDGCTFSGGDVCDCTDKQNRQRIRFYKFSHFAWPG
ncbi:MAG TPA: hypothetical protein VN634_03875 [Candidatus Limnocylindrales bacterium]|nr:hypothetical protein [Candidatus Limnocylindrales bacterium]